MIIKKSKNANIESKRTLFFQIGVVISLSLTLMAFEWTTLRFDKINFDFGVAVLIEEEMTAITEQKKKPEMPKPKIIQTIKIVPDEIETDEDIEITIEVTDKNVNELDFTLVDDSDEVMEEPTIFTVVEKMPQFPGGYSAMCKYLKDNLIYPEMARNVGIFGTVYVKFIVGSDGTVSDIIPERGIGGGCDAEACRVIASMPKWIPGMQRTKAVNVKMVLPVTFKLLN